jgi:uncharacterized protein YdaU (DUF1376 family)
VDKQAKTRDNLRSGTHPEANPDAPLAATRATKDSADMADLDSTPGRAPAFQFYPNDFLSDRNVIVMSMQERGIYITLICHAWQSPLPSDVAQLARICGTPLTSFRKLWPALAVCFRPHPENPAVLIHPRLERERAKQVEYRQKQSDRGKASGAARRKPHEPDANAGSIPVEPNVNAGSTTVQPRPVELLSSLQSSSSLVLSQTPSGAAVVDHRSKRPIFKGQRFVVFEWMLDDLTRMLGTHANAFDLHSWFFALDQMAEDAGIVVPQRDGGRWLQERTQEEALKRGLPLAVASHNPKTAGNAAAAARFVARGQS